MNLSMESILERINQTDRFEDMRVIRDQVHEMLRERLLFFHSVELHRFTNQFHDACIRRTVYLSEQLLESHGIGKPPVPYAFMLFGSGGRGEQTLWSDQDNGFIYEDPTTHSKEHLDAYFVQLITAILHGLDILGYPPCEGNVVSSNPQWRKPLSEYINMMMEWFVDPNWEHVRYLLIMADLRGIYGEASLVARLRGEFFQYVQNNPLILQSMLSNTLHHKVSLGPFGQLITERYGEDAGGVDIKYGAYIPIVNGIRLLAIQAGIQTPSTLDRIRELSAAGFIDERHAKQWEEAFVIAIKLRDLTPFQVEDGLYTTRGKLTADQLTKERKHELKFCLREGLELQKFVRANCDVRQTGRDKG